MNISDPERIACTPRPLDSAGWNPNASLPHGLEISHVRASMQEFLDFLGFLNEQMATRSLPRFEAMLMPANFSSIVGEFLISTIPKHCEGLIKNARHNGHPDLLPRGRFPGNAALHADEGIEVKSSRYLRGWQGHNPEATWLMVFVFESNRPTDADRDVAPLRFRFVKVVGALLATSDWNYSGRSETSRRTITASINPVGFAKMEANWLYRDPATPSPAQPQAAPAEPLSEAAIEVEGQGPVDDM